MITTTTNAKCTDVGRFLEILHPTGVFEVRAMNVEKYRGGFAATVSGYFDDHAEAVQSITEIADKKPPAVYLTLNPVAENLLGRRNNRTAFVDPKSPLTGKENVIRRTAMMIDIDPSRESGISSTDTEMMAALHLADEIEATLTASDWPSPLKGMSGNGAYLIYGLDLPNNAESETLIKDCLDALHFLFMPKAGHAAVHVDTSTFDANRLCKALGTWARKGDNYTAKDPAKSRPHRQSWFYDIDEPLQPVPEECLRLLAAKKPEPEKPTVRQPATSNGSSFDLERWIETHNVPVGNGERYSGGTKWIFNSIAPPCESHPGGHGADGAAFIIQRPDGTIQAGCRHARCDWKWQDLRKHYEPDAYTKKEKPEAASTQSRQTNEQPQQSHQPQPNTEAKPESELEIINPVRLNDLLDQHPELRPYVVDGVMRLGETVNIIASPKIGKSFLAGNLACCIASGRPWFGHNVQEGRVLIIDNELHPETVAHRLHRIAIEMQLSDEERSRIDIICLRGHLLDINALEMRLSIEPGRYVAVMLDALYRTIPNGVSENDNSGMMSLYNRLDLYAAKWQSSIVVVHHSSKGNQNEKSITDVGAGAGSISRAADTHISIRPHESDGLAVLEAVTRSSVSPEPISIKFEYPLWNAVSTAPALKQPNRVSSEAQKAADLRDREVLLEMIPESPNRIQQKMLFDDSGFGVGKCKRLAGQLVRDKQVDRICEQEGKRDLIYYTRKGM